MECGKGYDHTKYTGAAFLDVFEGEGEEEEEEEHKTLGEEKTTGSGKKTSPTKANATSKNAAKKTDKIPKKTSATTKKTSATAKKTATAAKTKKVARGEEVAPQPTKDKPVKKDAKKPVKKAEDVKTHLHRRVLGNWEDYGDWFAGEITAVNDDNTVNISYDDGDYEENVPRQRYRLTKETKKRKSQEADDSDSMDDVMIVDDGKNDGKGDGVGSKMDDDNSDSMDDVMVADDSDGGKNDGKGDGKGSKVDDDDREMDDDKETNNENDENAYDGTNTIPIPNSRPKLRITKKKREGEGHSEVTRIPTRPSLQSDTIKRKEIELEERIRREAKEREEKEKEKRRKDRDEDSDDDSSDESDSDDEANCWGKLGQVKKKRDLSQINKAWMQSSSPGKVAIPDIILSTKSTWKEPGEKRPFAGGEGDMKDRWKRMKPVNR